MKILIIANNATGLYRFRGMLIKELIERGNDVEAILPVANDVNEQEVEKKLEMMGCSLKKVFMDCRGINPFKDIKLLLMYHKLIKKMVPDLVITYTIKPNIYGGCVCRMLRIPYVANITGLGTAVQEKSKIRTLVLQLYKIALKRAKVVFFENSQNRDDLVNMKVVDKKYTYVLNGAGVDLEYFSYADYPDGEEIKFLYIGRVMQEKGIDELFDSMHRLLEKNVKCSLHIVGGLEEKYAEKIEMYIQEGWLHYYGFQNDVRNYITGAHCFVLPSWHEGMANANLECAAMGRPVITSNIAGCREAVIEEISGMLCDKKDSEHLYQTMKRFAALSYETRKKMGMMGREHMVQVFDKKKVVNDTINKIYDVVNAI